jgi:hypothetical protein
MIIRHFDFRCFAAAESENDPELVADPDALFPLEGSFQRFQAIARRRFKVLIR